MTCLINCQDLEKSFGEQNLFSGVSFTVHPGDRIGLVGPNGSGKSTLLRIMAGLDEPDHGTIITKRHLHIGYLPQSETFTPGTDCAGILSQELHSHALDPAEQQVRIHSLLNRAGFTDPHQPVDNLSGGWQKRLAVCKALVGHPDVLLLDEPTNHLDLEGILWLEKLLLAQADFVPAAWIVVSHDRCFLENTTTRIIEINRVFAGGCLQVKGCYSDFLLKKQETLSIQQEREERLKNRLRRENEWLSRGPKARTSKARYRIREARQLQEDLATLAARNRENQLPGIAFSATGRKTRKLLVATKISKRFGRKQLFSGLDLVLTPGSRLGLLGRNGCGKSTLMQILAAAGGDGPKPDSGSIRLAEGVRIVSFDQRRSRLDSRLTLARALAPEGDSVVYRGRAVHLVSWANRFLFRPDQLETPVGRLSGGEQARILIARLMLRPADILLLDEPTNDLDIPALQVLEESLLDFPGALVLVTHDRFLLDRICDRVLGFDGGGGTDFFSDYSQWLRSLRDNDGTKGEKPGHGKKRRTNEKRPGKLSYLDQREYDQMEERILAAEEEEKRLQNRLLDPDIMADQARLQDHWQRLEAIQQEIERLYNRWQELEEKKNQLS